MYKSILGRVTFNTRVLLITVLYAGMDSSDTVLWWLIHGLCMDHSCFSTFLGFEVERLEDRSV